jgi:hypothetical protein
MACSVHCLFHTVVFAAAAAAALLQALPFVSWGL